MKSKVAALEIGYVGFRGEFVGFLERFYRWNGIVAGAVVFAVAIMTTADALKRWLHGKPFVGVFELSEIGFLIFTFLVLGLLECQGRQINIDILSSRIRGKPGYLLAAFTALAGLAWWGLILWTGGVRWLRDYAIHDVRPGLILIPTTIHLGFLVYGSVLICLVLLTSMVLNFWRVFASAEEAARPFQQKRAQKDSL